MIFKLGQRVRVCKDQPDFNKASAAYPDIGLEGIVVQGRQYERFKVPEGKVAVRFSAKQLGYEDYNEPDRRFCYYFMWAWALEPAPNKRKRKQP